MKKFYILSFIIIFFISLNASAQTDEKTFEIFGFVQLDAGYQVKQIGPDWYDVQRPTQLPGYKDQYAPDGRIFFSARQTRLGIKSSMPTSLGNFSTRFELDLFGSGKNAGQTAIRLRYAYGQIGHFGAGQTTSPYTDPDVGLNQIEFWGFTGMLYFRNLQIRYMPVMEKNHDVAIALENPGASGDGGVYKDRIELKTVEAYFNVPDLTAHYRYIGDWGYVQFGGVLGSIKWRNINDTARFNLNGSAVRWGGSVSSNINLGKKAVFKFQCNYGEGIQNYFNDAPVDVGIQNNFSDPISPIKGVALPVLGISAGAEIKWSRIISSSFGYSATIVDNTDGQANDAYKMGQYSFINLLCYPLSDMMSGIEFIYARRDNKDGFHSDNPQIRVAFKYSFSRLFTF
jgi:hypothetical protein